MKKRFRTRHEAAQYLTEQGLKTSPKYLQKLATVGGGPLYQRWGNKALYTDENLDAWAAAKLSAPRHSTSEAA